MDHSQNPQSLTASPAEPGNSNQVLGPMRRAKAEVTGCSVRGFFHLSKATHKRDLYMRTARIAFSWNFLAFAVVYLMVSFSFAQEIGRSRDGLMLFQNVLLVIWFLGIGTILLIAWWFNLMQRKASRRLAIVASSLNLLVLLGSAGFVYFVSGFVKFRQAEGWCLGIPTAIAIAGSIIYLLPIGSEATEGPHSNRALRG